MTHTPLDALFKATFSDLANAERELRAVLPPALVRVIDWSTLRVEPGSYVDDELKERHSDLLYSARIGSMVVHIYVLFEHRSEGDADMVFRLLRYMVRGTSTCAISVRSKGSRLPSCRSPRVSSTRA